MLKLSVISTSPMGVSVIGVLTFPGLKWLVVLRIIFFLSLWTSATHLTNGFREREIDEITLAMSIQDCCNLDSVFSQGLSLYLCFETICHASI